MVLRLVTVLLLGACSVPTDGDGDGHPAALDCDDTRARTHPGAPETCDGRDNDCDGEVDEGAADAPTWFLDADADGVGGSSELDACFAPEGHTAVSGDCDDTNRAAYPDAIEVGDGADNDCDGSVDEACGSGSLGVEVTNT